MTEEAAAAPAKDPKDEALHAALNGLSDAMGNPALGWDENTGTLEQALVIEATRRLRERQTVTSGIDRETLCSWIEAQAQFSEDHAPDPRAEALRNEVMTEARGWRKLARLLRQNLSLPQ